LSRLYCSQRAASSLSSRTCRRVRSHCRFRNRGTEYVSKCGIKRMGGSTRRRAQQ
jgi:hypothetical protein